MSSIKIKKAIGSIKEAAPKVLSPLSCPLQLTNNYRTTTKYYNLVKYYGGKYDKLSTILHYIELVARANNASAFIECFGGGGKCILNIDTINHHFKKKMYNELDVGMCSLFKMASGIDTAKQLMKELSCFDYTRETFRYCRSHRNDNNLCDLYRACMVFMLCQMGYNGSTRNYSKFHEGDLSYINAINRIAYAPEHLKDVEITNGDYKDIMKKYGEDSLVVKYLDPPYHPTCRNQDALQEYQNELTQQQHQEMVSILCQSKSWILSGYDPAQWGCSDYEPLEKAGAVKVSIGEYMISATKGSIQYKEEFLWYKV